MTKKQEDIALGKKIKEIRSSLKLDQKTFSNKIGSTVSALSNWENGRNKPNDVMLKSIADLGDLTVEELLHGEKSALEKLYDNANPKIIGKQVAFVRLAWNDSIESFVERINISLMPYQNASLINDNQLKRVEKGIDLPTIEQCHVISSFVFIKLENFLNGEITNKYDFDVIKSILKKIGYDSKESELRDVVTALNQTEILKVQAHDIVQMYVNNIDNPNPYINNDKTLLAYLCQKKEIFESFLDEGSLPDEIKMDISVEVSSISQDINQIKAYNKIYK